MKAKTRIIEVITELHGTHYEVEKYHRSWWGSRWVVIRDRNLSSDMSRPMKYKTKEYARLAILRIEASQVPNKRRVVDEG